MKETVRKTHEVLEVGFNLCYVLGNPLNITLPFEYQILSSINVCNNVPLKTL